MRMNYRLVIFDAWIIVPGFSTNPRANATAVTATDLATPFRASHAALVAVPQRASESKPGTLQMLYRSLGKTGLRVSEIGFGCASYWGKKVFDEAAAIRLIEAAVDHGVTFFDTGASYSGGNAEPRLGKALSRVGNGRNLVIATKAGSYTDERGRWREDFSPSGVRRSVEASLVRLGLDAIPPLHLHC